MPLQRVDSKQRPTTLPVTYERDWLRMVISRHRGNVLAAARDAGITAVQLARLLHRYGLIELHTLRTLLRAAPPGPGAARGAR